MMTIDHQPLRKERFFRVFESKRVLLCVLGKTKKARNRSDCKAFNVSKWRDLNPRPFGPEDVVFFGKSVLLFAFLSHAPKGCQRCAIDAREAESVLLKRTTPAPPFPAAGGIAALVWECVTVLTHSPAAGSEAVAYRVITVISVIPPISSYIYAQLHYLFIF